MEGRLKCAFGDEEDGECGRAAKGPAFFGGHARRRDGGLPGRHVGFIGGKLGRLRMRLGNIELRRREYAKGWKRSAASDQRPGEKEPRRKEEAISIQAERSDGSVTSVGQEESVRNRRHFPKY